MSKLFVYKNALYSFHLGKFYVYRFNESQNQLLFKKSKERFVNCLPPKAFVARKSTSVSSLPSAYFLHIFHIYKIDLKQILVRDCNKKILVVSQSVLSYHITANLS